MIQRLQRSLRAMGGHAESDDNVVVAGVRSAKSGLFQLFLPFMVRARATEQPTGGERG